MTSVYVRQPIDARAQPPIHDYAFDRRREIAGLTPSPRDERPRDGSGGEADGLDGHGGNPPPRV